jgi:cytidyltransferase-related domain
MGVRPRPVQRGAAVTLGLTIGVFDLLHEGHDNLLTQAARHCDQLYVGVMTDYWVRVQKGHDRPVDSLETRLLRVQAHPAVHKAFACDTLNMSAYLHIVDVWILGEWQRNMQPLISPVPTVRIAETPGVSTTRLLEGS